MPISNPISNSNSSSSVAKYAIQTKVSVGNAATVLVVSANVNRLGLTVVNTHTATIFLGITAGVTSQNYMIPLSPGAIYEMLPGYTGGIWAIGTFDLGDLLITDFRSQA